MVEGWNCAGCGLLVVVSEWCGGMDYRLSTIVYDFIWLWGRNDVCVHTSQCVGYLHGSRKGTCKG